MRYGGQRSVGLCNNNAWNLPRLPLWTEVRAFVVPLLGVTEHKCKYRASRPFDKKTREKLRRYNWAQREWLPLDMNVVRKRKNSNKPPNFVLLYNFSMSELKVRISIYFCSEAENRYDSVTTLERWTSALWPLQSCVLCLPLILSKRLMSPFIYWS